MKLQLEDGFTTLTATRFRENRQASPGAALSTTSGGSQTEAASVLALEAMKLWRDSAKEAKAAAVFGGALYWQTAFGRFEQKWRAFHPTPQGPELEPRCAVLCELLSEGDVYIMIGLDKYTDAEVEQLGEFCVLVVVLGIRDALLFDAERAALMYEHLPSDWLRAADIDRPKFDQWYSARTGATYKPRGC